MKTLECFPTEKKKRGKEQKQERNDDRDARCDATPLAERKGGEPKRRARDKNAEAGAREVNDERGNKHAKTCYPKQPAFASFAEIILAASQDHDRSQAEKIS